MIILDFFSILAALYFVYEFGTGNFYIKMLSWFLINLLWIVTVDR